MGEAKVIASHGMGDVERDRIRSNITENMEVARQCREAAAQVAVEYPIAARLLLHEARHWQGS